MYLLDNMCWLITDSLKGSLKNPSIGMLFLKKLHINKTTEAIYVGV